RMRTFSVIFSIVLLCASAVQPAEQIAARDAKIDNVQLHYLTAGKAPTAVIPSPGLAQTSRMWRPIMPTLPGKVTVNAPALPGVPGWEPIYNASNIWHFRFNGEYPEKLVKGRERTYFEYFWNVLATDKTRSLPEADRKAYTDAYAKPGRMRAAWTYFASWPQLAKDFAQLSQTKLRMPVLSIGGEKSLGNELGAQMKLVADNVTVIVLPNT